MAFPLPKAREHLTARLLQLVGGCQQLHASCGDACAATAGAAHRAIDQRHPREVSERVDCLPGRLVTDSRIAPGLRDRATGPDQPQDLDAFVRCGLAEGFDV